MTKAEILKLLEKYGDDVDFPGAKLPGDDFPRSKKNGFDFNGVWIDNPTYEETGRFPFKSMQDSISHYGDTNADAIKRMYEELGELVADTEDEAKNIADGYTDDVLLDKDENGNVIEPEADIPEYTGDDDFDEYTDYVLSNYKGPFPSDDATEADWDEFYTGKDSPFKKYEADMWAKAPTKAKAEWENAVPLDPFKDLKTVYTTTDDTGLAWKDPVAFKKFVIGGLIAGLPKDEREEALKYYWKFTPEELIKHRDTNGSVTSFDATATDDSGAVIFDPYDKNISWDLSLRDQYGTGKDNDPFDEDLYDLLDNFNGDIEDVNGDGDPDVMTEDTDGDGEADAATITADDEAEASEAVDSAKESLDDKKVEQDSTGSLNDKPSEDVSDEKLKNKKSSGCVSDEKVKDKKHPEDCSCAECTKKKEQELSDSRFKNIVNTLVDKLW